MKRIYLCDQTINGMYAALYDAWRYSRHEEAGIAFKDTVEHQLFCEYQEVFEDRRKAVAVEQLIKNHLGYQAYWDIYHALLSEDAERADVVFRVMQTARTVPNSKKIMEHLTDPSVLKVFELSRRVANEAHLFMEVIRFRELDNGVLFSDISPASRILTCIGDHFTDRFPVENWMIYDKTHQEILIHKAHMSWILVSGETADEERTALVSDAEKEFSYLWKGFFESTAIEERRNERCQRTHLPLRYRKNMTEFM